ncbi:hypothetical protein NQ314_015970 [Rhamnusium bicolor]|uniref:DDE Tnp4 domain-containing protein n=1 Tax=Rhamnusium bicolor TaxID=1586634 RepID=A0AAV8WXK0_9CUCU|nr:hypothetical protein NQ314_015970 [Rhamnusium bicolor]
MGDSGYALRPWLLTPLQNPQGNNEETYNTKYKANTATIERCNSSLKIRFRCLLKHRALHGISVIVITVVVSLTSYFSLIMS